MTSTPPEPSPWPATPPGDGPMPAWPPAPGAFTPPPAYAPPPAESRRQPRPRMSVLRIVSGVIWGVIALICAAGAVGEFLIGIPGGGVLCAVIAAGSGWYDYRVWTRRSRRVIA